MPKFRFNFEIWPKMSQFAIFGNFWKSGKFRYSLMISGFCKNWRSMREIPGKNVEISQKWRFLRKIRKMCSSWQSLSKTIRLLCMQILGKIFINFFGFFWGSFLHSWPLTPKRCLPEKTRESVKNSENPKNRSFFRWFWRLFPISGKSRISGKISGQRRFLWNLNF